jgi:hypothetical protein
MSQSGSALEDGKSIFSGLCTGIDCMAIFNQRTQRQHPHSSCRILKDQYGLLLRSSPMMEGDVRRRGIDSEDERMETESNMVASCYMHGNVPAAALLVIRVQCLLTDCV